MTFRTDLAIERREISPDNTDGIEQSEQSFGNSRITRIRVTNENGARSIGKPVGTYVTVEVPPFTDDATPNRDTVEVIKTELSAFLPNRGTVLVAGLGNTDITPDALGPKTAAGVLATRHITGELARSIGLGSLRGVAVIAPGVLGQTGIESVEIIAGTVERVRPSAVIVVDALASRRLSRLGCTVQMADSGISPGAGVGNRRKEISSKSLGVPVISVGVPTVVDAVTLAQDLTGRECESDVEPRGAKMIVTPREIDLLIDRAAQLISHAINCTLQPDIDPEILLSLV